MGLKTMLHPMQENKKNNDCCLKFYQRQGENVVWKGGIQMEGKVVPRKSSFVK